MNIFFRVEALDRSLDINDLPRSLEYIQLLLTKYKTVDRTLSFGLATLSAIVDSYDFMNDDDQSYKKINNGFDALQYIKETIKVSCTDFIAENKRREIHNNVTKKSNIVIYNEKKAYHIPYYTFFGVKYLIKSRVIPYSPEAKRVASTPTKNIFLDSDNKLKIDDMETYFHNGVYLSESTLEKPVTSGETPHHKNTMFKNPIKIVHKRMMKNSMVDEYKIFNEKQYISFIDELFLTILKRTDKIFADMVKEKKKSWIDIYEHGVDTENIMLIDLTLTKINSLNDLTLKDATKVVNVMHLHKNKADLSENDKFKDSCIQIWKKLFKIFNSKKLAKIILSNRVILQTAFYKNIIDATYIIDIIKFKTSKKERSSYYFNSELMYYIEYLFKNEISGIKRGNNMQLNDVYKKMRPFYIARINENSISEDQIIEDIFNSNFNIENYSNDSYKVDRAFSFVKRYHSDIINILTINKNVDHIKQLTGEKI